MVDAATAFYDDHAPSYDADYDLPEVKAEDLLVASWLRQTIPWGSSVLDLGCGTGWVVDHLEGEPVTRQSYRGVDASAGMLAMFHGKHPAWKARTQQGRIEDRWPDYPNDWRGDTRRIALCLWSVANHVDPRALLGRFGQSRGDLLVVLARTHDRPLSHLADGYAVPPGFGPIEPYEFGRIAHEVGLTVRQVRGFKAGAVLCPVDEADYVWYEIEGIR